jgi:hypothetical protein
MAHAYTPGLRVTPYAVVRKDRRLPLQGNVVAAVGDIVGRDQVVARTDLPGDVVALNLVNRLGCSPAEVPRYMLHKEGDVVQEGTPLAETQPFIKWFKSTVNAPATGVVESISSVTGQVILRKEPRPVEVLAYVDGQIVEVFEGEGVSVETRGAYIQGIFGVGGECWGPLHVAVDAPDQLLTSLGEECAGKIVVVGSLITQAIIDRARQVGAIGLVGGGLRDQDLRDLLGYDLGVAITGDEDIGLTVIVTEGFGEIAIARKTFDILKDSEGKETSISGATQIRAGVLRPEIIVPEKADVSNRSEARGEGEHGMDIGDLLRVIRVPYFGRIGRVSALPTELQEVESGARVRVLEVEFENGERAVVPRANIEMIEE